jgi:hypothetical protein
VEPEVVLTKSLESAEALSLKFKGVLFGD